MCVARLFSENAGLRGAAWLLVWLLVGDAVFVAVHLVNECLLSGEYALLSLEADRSLSEVFQYAKELGVVVLLVVLAWRRSLCGLLSWAALFVFVLCDDAFSLHEGAGVWLGAHFDLAVPHVSGAHVGEVLASAIAGGFFLGMIGLAYFFGGKWFRLVSLDLILLFGILAFFGVAVDLLHVALYNHLWMRFFLAIVEDGGEMVTLSVIVVYVYQYTVTVRSLSICRTVFLRLRARFVGRGSRARTSR